MDEVAASEPGAAPNILRQALDGIYTQVLNGFGVFPSAADLAHEYLAKNQGDARRAAGDMINWQMTKAATSGFITNLGGAATLPISIPANISSVLYIQLRMIAAIAVMGGHDIHEDRVRTLVYTSLLGAAAADVLKEAGIKIGESITRAAIMKITSAVAKKMASSAVARLLARMGLSSASHFAKLVPVAGGVVAAAMDATATKAIGAIATQLFISHPPPLSHPVSAV